MFKSRPNSAANGGATCWRLKRSLMLCLWLFGTTDSGGDLGSSDPGTDHGSCQILSRQNGGRRCTLFSVNLSPLHWEAVCRVPVRHVVALPLSSKACPSFRSRASCRARGTTSTQLGGRLPADTHSSDHETNDTVANSRKNPLAAWRKLSK